MTDDRREPLSELDAILGEEDSGRPSAQEPPAPDPLDPVLGEEGEETAPGEGDETSPGPEDVRPQSALARIRRWLLPALAVVFAVAAGLFAFLWQQEAGEHADREAVTEVAERFTQNLITFDYRTLDSDIERIRRDATGSFQGELDVAFGGDIDAFREALREARAESSGSVLGSIVRSLEADTARVLVVADQRIQNEETPEPRTIPRRIELTLVETSEGWKVDRVDASGALTGGG